MQCAHRSIQICNIVSVTLKVRGLHKSEPKTLKSLNHDPELEKNSHIERNGFTEMNFAA